MEVACDVFLLQADPEGLQWVATHAQTPHPAWHVFHKAKKVATRSFKGAA